MSTWSSLDPRATAAWTEFAATGAAEADNERFQKRLHRPGWVHAYPPVVFREAAADEVTELGLRLAELVSDFPRRAFGEDLEAWAGYLGVPAEDAELMISALRHPRTGRAATAIMRPDLVVTDDGLRLVELNVSTPMGGMSTIAPYTEATLDSEYARFLAARGLTPEAAATSHVWLDMFVGLLREHETERPLHVFEAIANPADSDSGRRFFVDMIRSGGYEISCGLVTDLELDEEGASFEGRRVDVVVTMYTWHETKKHVPPALTRRLMELDIAEKIDFIGAPATALHDNKGNLALLTEPEFDHLLSDEERSLARAHVPETFRLRADTLDRALAEREELICKPASAYGGKDLAFGFTQDDGQWRVLLTERLADPNETYVLQRRLRPAVVDVPGADPAGREVVLAPLVFGGRFAGTFLRQAPPRSASAINASSGAEAAGVLTFEPYPAPPHSPPSPSSYKEL
ncbi:hypothetical protein ACFYXV_30125 [Streptomyces sp. NPDC002181]|uniref:hypothetical protein n=1 Tax=unclassified Streptomyces TaxID=2593676 RepID=UPI003660606C